jgi:hypothetical protein
MMAARRSKSRGMGVEEQGARPGGSGSTGGGWAQARDSIEGER